MRIAILADIHANLQALEAVIADAGSVDEWWCLGDIVGYGADPVACIELMSTLPHLAVPGNHDLGAVGEAALDRFNGNARTCLQWTAKQLGSEHKRYVLALAPKIVRDPFTLVHASPRDTVWEYIVSGDVARANMPHFSTPLCLVGHTHRTAAFSEDGTVDFARASAALMGQPVPRFICNPGATGQPRDGNPRAAYMKVDTVKGELAWHRVAYDWHEAARRITAAGLPEIEASRLRTGN